MGGLLSFCYHQLFFKPRPLSPSTILSGKTALITGANSGLGLEAARELASHELSHLMITARDVSKGEAAKDTILKSSPNCNVDVWPLDYDSYDSIAEFGQRVKGLERLDYALLNAGVKALTYEKSSAGHELNVQINHIGTSAVSLLLLPVLRKMARETKQPSRMTIVSSEGHFWVPFDERRAPNILKELDDKTDFGRIANQRYYTTKLLNVLWTRELASRVERLGPGEVIVNTVNPGFCSSGFHRHESSVMNRLFLSAFAWTSAQGGHCLTDALVLHEESHGEYLSGQRKTPYAFRPSSSLELL